MTESARKNVRATPISHGKYPAYLHKMTSKVTFDCKRFCDISRIQWGLWLSVNEIFQCVMCCLGHMEILKLF